MTKDAATSIRDPDLLEQLEAARGAAGFDTLARLLSDEQAKRDNRAAMTPIKRRRDIAREEIANYPLGDDDRQYIHSVLALCGLPYKRPDDDTIEYERTYGKSSLIVTAGKLKNPETGDMVRPGIPYGPKSRLLMLHLCSRALIEKTPTIDVGDSMSAFMKELGFAVTGGKRGSISAFKEQLQRLSAAHMQIGLWDGKRASTINETPIKRFDLWFPEQPGQRMLWNSTVTLSTDFYESLQRHAMPVDMRSVHSFKHSARHLDVIYWLGYRLKSLSKPYMVTWPNLIEQFGADSRVPRDVKQKLRGVIEDLKEVYPSLPVSITEKGLMLRPSDQEKLFVPPKRITRPRR